MSRRLNCGKPRSENRRKRAEREPILPGKDYLTHRVRRSIDSPDRMALVSTTF